jgi:hypothetical protein
MCVKRGGGAGWCPTGYCVLGVLQGYLLGVIQGFVFIVINACDIGIKYVVDLIYRDFLCF